MLDDMERARAAFLEEYSSVELASRFERLRHDEYGRLDKTKQIYLDYTGGGLYAECQLRQCMELLSSNVFGNPHSINPSSFAMTELVERTRAYVLEYFNASADEYCVIFTPNASGALKHVGESYPFHNGANYLLTVDNHNSVNGIREFARAKGARVTYLPVTYPEMRIDGSTLLRHLDLAAVGTNNLFAFPAQSNFSGVQHPLEMVEQAQAKGWDVLLDAAAFVPTNRLDLGTVKPDFVSLSFYKMVGFPTGIGALIVRKAALRKLHRPWFAGGTVSIVSVDANGHFLVESEAAFEDGTVNYLNLPAVDAGLRHLATIGIAAIHEHVMSLTGWLLDQLAGLHHRNGAPLVRIHGPTKRHMRGGTIAFDLHDPQGRNLDASQIETLAGAAHISLRTGCFCNPGAGETAYNLTKHELGAVFSRDKAMTFQQLREYIAENFGKEVSAIRVSVGIGTNFNDVYHFLRFVQQFLDKTAAEVGQVSPLADAYASINRRDSA